MLDAYSCIMYILSYISKSEHAMSQLLEATLQEARNENLEVKEQLKKMGSSYLSHREISAQEAVYRALSMPLKCFSRDTIFIPAHKNCTRMSVPLRLMKNNDGSDESPWMTNIVDRYHARPCHKTFETMCLAKFASGFRVVRASSDPNQAEDSSVSLDSKSKFTLQNGLGEIAKRTKSKDAIIRYPKFSRTKQPEDYFFVLLKLYLPHRNDDQLKPSTFETYEDFYLNGSVKLNKTRIVEKVSRIVNENRELFEIDADCIDRAEEMVMGGGTGCLEDAWANIAPGMEQQRNDEETEQLMNSLVEDDELIEEIDWPSDSNTVQQCGSSAADIQIDSTVHKQNMDEQLQMLNEQQQNIFYAVRKWCIRKVNEESVDPFFIFVNGSAGVGKSHLIRSITYEAERVLEPLKNDIEDVLITTLCATGCAAHNVNGLTLHSYLQLPLHMGMIYYGLTENVLNTLRCKLEKLHIIIIDEISMVSSAMLGYIHGRLTQIKQNSAPFGNVAILAVGDFYQLPPVKGIPLYRNSLLDLWQDNFRITTLSKIMRQNNVEFAEMLNRFRVHKKGTPISDDDMKVLEERSKAIKPDDVLHVYSKNKDVDAYNKIMLDTKCSDIHTIHAIDIVRIGSKTYKKKQNVSTDGLPEVIKLAVNAKVLLIRNLDVSDGLCNGAFGTVSGIIMNANDSNMPRCVCVQFQSESVGRKARTKSNFDEVPTGSVCIFPFEEVYMGGKLRRQQIPLKLAFAATIHKVQGMTVDKINVSMEGIFAPGQGYVSLSRVTSVSGLFISHLNPEKTGIFCNDEVSAFLEKMKPLDLCCALPPLWDVNENCLTVVYHNVEGLQSHLKGIVSHNEILKASVFIASETWIETGHDISTFEIPGFSVLHKTRGQCTFYNGKTVKKGGVTVYVNELVPHKFIEITNEIEAVAVLLPEFDCIVIGLYRSPTFPMPVFVEKLKTMLENQILKHVSNIIIMGDFNENLNAKGNHPVLNFFISHNFKQLIKDYTTSRGSLLDAIYFFGNLSVCSGILNTWFSYHEPVYIIANKP